jgi:hypothetical protein
MWAASRLSPVTRRTETSWPASQPDGLGGAGLGRVEEGEQSPQRHLGLVRRHGEVGPGQWSAGQGEHAVAVAAELGEPLLQPGLGLAERHGPAIDLGVGAHLEHLAEGALGDQQRGAVVADQHAEPLALEVIGDLVQPGASVGRCRAGKDRLVQGVGEAVLEAGVEPGQPEYLVAGAAGEVERGVQADRTGGDGAGLVGAQHRHGAEILDGVQPLDDDLLGRHPPGAGGQADAHDGGQQLRGEPDGQGKREQQRLDQGTVQHQVDHEDRGDQHHHRPHQQQPERGDAALEPRLEPASGQLRGDSAELGRMPCPGDDRLAGAADHVGAHEQAVGTTGQRRGGGEHAGALLDRIGLTGQGRLIDQQLLRPDDPAVGRHDIAGVEHQHVADHDILHGHRALLAAAADLHLHPDLGHQRIDGLSGAVLLPEA